MQVPGYVLTAVPARRRRPLAGAAFVLTLQHFFLQIHRSLCLGRCRVLESQSVVMWRGRRMDRYDGLGEQATWHIWSEGGRRGVNCLRLWVWKPLFSMLRVSPLFHFGLQWVT